MAKLRSMTETIKMLSTENVALREENDGLVMMRGSTSGIQDQNLPKMSLLKSLHICSLYHKELFWICLYALYNIFIKLVVDWWCFLHSLWVRFGELQ